MAYFVGNFLGPQFEQDGVDAGILFATINRDNPAYSRVALDDAKAKKYWMGAGYQWDGKGAIPYINKEYPHLKLYHTEAECGNGSNDWGAAEHTWWQICHYFRHGARNFQYWNMVLDHTGVSPWGWKQNSLVTVNTETKQVTYNPEYYLMKHLGHYLQQGAHYLSLEGDGDNLVAFANPDGTTAMLLVNRDNQPKRLSVNIAGKYINITLKPKSFNTLHF
jgi:glucosylceramidase